VVDLAEKNFIERRREHRLPFQERVIFSDGRQSTTQYAVNISRGGLFMTSLDPLPMNTVGYLAFLLHSHPTSLCVKARVAHIMFDRQRCEIDCGMGFQFVDMNESQRAIINTYILNIQRSYLELKRILAAPSPNALELQRALRQVPRLQGLDLLALRYKVNRVCTVFETPAELDLSESA
jgi:Tfp pilus assembly protein PilZ